MASDPELGEAVSAADHGADEVEDVYQRIVRASAIIAMSSAMNIGIGIVRTKLMAMLLGPAGFGLMGLYNSIVDLAVSIAGMGVNNSGVRQIAEAASSDDRGKIARTAAVLRRVSILLGLLGACGLAVLASPVSILSFGDASRASAITLLAVAVFLRLIAAGRGALLQGLRRIGDIARVNVSGAALGTMASLPIIYFLREDGVALALVAVATFTLVPYWWYSRDIRVEGPNLATSGLYAEASQLIRLGMAFMLSGFFVMGSAYAVRLILTRDISLEAAGLYSSAWTLGGLYVGYVLQAMGTDFYPQLVGVANDHDRCNRLVNDQMLVSLLLAGPGILATITFAPVVVALFYSLQFAGAAEVLRWICAGMAMRVVTWPMSYIIVAKNLQLIFLAVDLGWTVANIGLTWMLVKHFGLPGAGIAFLASYILHGLVVYPTVHALTGFTWNSNSRVAIILYILSIVIVMSLTMLFPPVWSLVLGGIITVISFVYSAQKLFQMVSGQGVPANVARLIDRVRKRYSPRGPQQSDAE